jgi:hypothetical protein
MITVREAIGILVNCDMDAPVMVLREDGFCHPAEMRCTDDEFENPVFAPASEAPVLDSGEYDQQLAIDSE